MQAWIQVGSPDNFDVSAFKASRRKQSGEMKPGDRIVYYLTKEVLFGGIVEVTGEMFEDTSDIGLRSAGKPGEDYPFRIDTKPLVIPERGNYIDVRDITDLLDKTRKLGPKKLGIAFRGNLHRISDADYEAIEQLLQERL
jgi:predicted RNA-binding protein